MNGAGAARLRLLLRPTLGLQAAPRILQSHSEVVVAPHLDPQLVEFGLSRFNRW